MISAPIKMVANMAYRQARDNIRTGIGSDSPWIAAPAGNSPEDKKRPSSAEDERSWSVPDPPGPKMEISSLRQPGRPPALRSGSGPVALRHQIALVLPFRSSLFWWFLGTGPGRCRCISDRCKKRPSSAEDERSWNIPVLPGPKMKDSPLRQPGCPPALKEAADPWLCVTRSLWLCPFGVLVVAADILPRVLPLQHEAFQPDYRPSKPR